MWALGVIDGAEAIEGTLLSAERAGGRASGFRLEGAVEAFMAAILLRMSGLDEFGADAQVEPPDLEFGEAEDGLSGKRDAIIRANQGREAELSEEAFEDGLDERERNRRERLAAEEEAAEGVDDGEGIAVHAIGGEELAFEVHGPDVIGLLGHSERAPRMAWRSPAPTWADEVSAFEEITDGAGCWPGHVLETAFEPGSDLARTPEGMVLADGDHAGLDLGIGGVGTRFRAAFAIDEARRTLLEVACAPLVAGLATDPIVGAEVEEVEETFLEVTDEVGALGHG